ncbi:MAG: DUF1134 domain-containing protein [Pseudomonadota bacterium]|nr:DUF1134 domain-containing protein [Pseudomonadota bacterium]MDP1905459.1 DUF1134 domain-containing protein [Pseudomonadota bacterium]MDP2351068.1 DUF1134 domain-containing protein [Pseudomonadota bacterium]
MRHLNLNRIFPSASRIFLLGLVISLFMSAQARAAEADQNTYDQDSIVKEAKEFFGEATEGLAKVIEKVFKEQGRPVGYIKGEELSAAITVGLSYGKGDLVLKNGETAKVFWQGPSIGFDLGFNASKVFTLVYNLPSKHDLYQRFPGVDGSLYWIAGVGVNYQRRQDIVLAPIRLGAGWRTGASVGYLHYTRERSYLPL